MHPHETTEREMKETPRKSEPGNTLCPMDAPPTKSCRRDPRCPRPVGHTGRCKLKGECIPVLTPAVAAGFTGTEEPATPMTATEAQAQALAEGLTLARADSQSGFRSVTVLPVKAKGAPRHQARVSRDGREVSLGCFATAEEAALHVARTPEAKARMAKEQTNALAYECVLDSSVDWLGQSSGLPDGWVCSTHTAPSGPYKRYEGPNGEKAQSLKQAWQTSISQREPEGAGRVRGGLAPVVLMDAAPQSCPRDMRCPRAGGHRGHCRLKGEGEEGDPAPAPAATAERATTEPPAATEASLPVAASEAGSDYWAKVEVTAKDFVKDHPRSFELVGADVCVMAAAYPTDTLTCSGAVGWRGTVTHTRGSSSGSDGWRVRVLGSWFRLADKTLLRPIKQVAPKALRTRWDEDVAVAEDGAQLVPGSSRTGYKGVQYNSGAYEVEVWRDGKQHHLGTFATMEEAALVHNNASSSAKGWLAAAKGAVAKGAAAKGKAGMHSVASALPDGGVCPMSELGKRGRGAAAPMPRRQAAAKAAVEAAVEAMSEAKAGATAEAKAAAETKAVAKANAKAQAYYDTYYDKAQP